MHELLSITRTLNNELKLVIICSLPKMWGRNPSDSFSLNMLRAETYFVPLATSPPPPRPEDPWSVSPAAAAEGVLYIGFFHVLHSIDKSQVSSLTAFESRLQIYLPLRTASMRAIRRPPASASASLEAACRAVRRPACWCCRLASSSTDSSSSSSSPLLLADGRKRTDNRGREKAV